MSLQPPINQALTPQIEQAVRDDKTYYKLKGESSVRAVSWDEDNTRWAGTKISDDSKHRWNADTKAWVAL